MVDAVQLASDILSNTGYLVLPPLVWLFLYWFAWERGPLARRLGFGRRTFWLLFPVGLVAQFANLPFFAWHGDILAVNLAGGFVPVVLSSMLLLRLFPEGGNEFGTFLVVFAGECAAMFAAILFVPARLDWLVLLPLAVLPALVLILLGSFGRPEGTRGVGLRRAGWLVAAASAMLYPTFVTTSTVPGAGIESAFPVYAIIPVAVGAVLALIVPSLFGLRRVSAIPIAYAAATFGVLIGADLLRQPPLYAGGPPALYAIGGAGLTDLLYLTGLLAAVAAFLTVRVVDAPAVGRLPVTPATPQRPGPLLRMALRLGASGHPGESVRLSRDATHLAVDQARTLRGAPLSPVSGGPWDTLPVPHWVAGDQRNLDALAEQTSVTPTDAYRGWLTARWLVRLGHELGLARFASFTERGWAFLLDLVLLTVPAVGLWTMLALVLPGSADEALGSLALNTAALGYASYGFLYFALLEGVSGYTVGKRWKHLEVTTRRTPSLPWRAVLLRNIPKLIPLTLIGVFGAGLVVLAVHSPGWSGASSGPVGTVSSGLSLFLVVSALVLGLGVCAAAAAISIAFSGERQRLGDVLAGTWVVRASPMGSALPSPAPSASGWAPVRSG